MRPAAWIDALALLGGQPLASPSSTAAPWVIGGSLLRGLLLSGFYLPVSAAFLPPDAALAATMVLGILLCAGRLDSATGRMLKVLGPPTSDRNSLIASEAALVAAIVVLRFILLRNFLGFETVKAIMAGSLTLGMETAIFLINTQWQHPARRLVNLLLNLLWIAALALLYRGFGAPSLLAFLMPGIMMWSCSRLCAAPGLLAWKMAAERDDRQALQLAPGALGEIGCYLAFLLLRYNFA